jgi:DNA-binding NarL/FixJ family response regulator/mono/diheme cytochrome c family protein
MGEAGVRLLERAEELAHLRACVERARGGSGSVVVIEGPAGIGKTSLLAAARAHAQEEGVQVLFARAGVLERELPWNLVRQLFTVVIRDRAQQQTELLAGAAGLAAPALGLAADAGGAAEIGALHGLYWLTTTLSERGPLLVAVDDAQWGDVDSLRYLAYMAERVADLPLLLAITVRSGEPQAIPLQVLARGAGLERIELHPLSGLAAAELARDALGDHASDEFCAACHTAAGGNPFLLGELLSQLRRDRVEPSIVSAHEVARVTPESVKRSVLLRLSVLPPACRELASSLAVLGGPARLAEAARVAKLDAGAAAASADALVEAGIFAPGPQLSFVHPVVREVIYGELHEHDRGQRHRAAAEVLAKLGGAIQRVAAQLVNAAPLGDEWTVTQLRDAARGALAEGAPHPAAEFLRRALQEPPPAPLRTVLLRELAAAEATDDSAAAIAHLEHALAAAQGGPDEAEIGLELALLAFRRAEMARGVELGRAALSRVASGARTLELRVISAAVTGAILVPALRGEIDPFLERIPDDLEPGSPDACLANSALLGAACARLASMPDIGVLAERALGDGTMLAAFPYQELQYWNAVAALILAERFDVAREAIDNGFEHARRYGSIIGFALASAFRCKLAHRSGAIAEGTADGWQALRALPTDDLHARAYAVGFLVDCLIERGELREALDVAAGDEFAGELPQASGFHLLRAARGRALIEAGNPVAGTRALLDLGAEMGEREFGPAMNPWRARAAFGLTMLERRREARELADEELSLARETRSGWAEAIALQALAAADPASAGEHLEQAIEVAASGGFALEHARSLLALGAWHRRAGKRAIAIDLLRQALDRSARCGALAVEQRARVELAAAGLRPRRRQLTGADSLTPAELRVAHLAAEGASNRAIAQSLFLSLRTVETHLTRTYQKLGIDSRGQLAGALATNEQARHAEPGAVRFTSSAR